MDLFRKKTIENNKISGMKKELKTSDLIMLGVGAIIGTGIFVVTGVAANQNAGPALSLSFVLSCNCCSVIWVKLC
jgi:APA family basic amino acid/polyamine antiporter